MALKIDATFGGILMAGLLLVIVGQIVPFVAGVIEDATPEMVVDTQATTEYTASGAAINGETITIGTEVYTVSGTQTGAFYLPNSSTASLAAAALVAEINANSTLVTASTPTVANVITITSIIASATGNYATTETMTNGAFTGLVMTGGVDGSQWSEMPGISDTWGTLVTVLGGGLALSAIFYAISPIIGKKMLGGE